MSKRIVVNGLDVFKNKQQLDAVIRTLESDRKRIANNLHDDIGSKLNVIALNCHLLKMPNLPQKDIEKITNIIIEYTSRVLDSSKIVTHSLLPTVLHKFGLQAGIEELLSEVIEKNTVEIQYENTIQFDFKDNDKHIHVFRILQELVSNSIKHSKASSISVSFYEINEKKVCNYSDNGIGFDVNQLKNYDGLGLKNVVSRVIVLGGSLSIESQINEGVSVIFNF